VDTGWPIPETVHGDHGSLKRYGRKVIIDLVVLNGRIVKAVHLLNYRVCCSRSKGSTSRGVDERRVSQEIEMPWRYLRRPAVLDKLAMPVNGRKLIAISPWWTDGRCPRSKVFTNIAICATSESGDCSGSVLAAEA